MAAITIAVALGIVICVLIWNAGKYGLFAITALESERGPLAMRAGLYACGLVVFICIWTVCSLRLPSGYTRVPLPVTVLDAFFWAAVRGDLLAAVGISAGRIIVGFGAAATLGICIGLVAGTYVVAGRLILPTASFFRYIPPTAFVTLLVVYFGIGDLYKYSVIFVGVFFFIIQMTVDAVRQVDRAYIEMALTSGVPRHRLLDQVVLRATAPVLMDVVRVNLSGAWTFLVLAEVVGAHGGLGHMIAVGQRFGRIESVYVAILAFGLIGVLSDLALQVGRNLMFRWSSLATRN